MNDYSGTPNETRRVVPVRLPAGQPVVTYTLIGLSVVVYLLQVVSQFALGGDLPAALGMKINSAILQGEWWRFFTPMLLHGSPLHIIFNMYALYAFGPGLERFYGRGRFLALYLLGGFAGNVVSFLMSTVNSLGASTAIFGLLGAEGILLYQNRDLFPNSRQALMNIVLIAVINLGLGLTPGSNIDNWGHIGGLIGGTLFAWLAGPKLEVSGIYPAMQVTDQRSSGAIWSAAITVGALFSGLAAAGIFLRLR